LGDLSGRAIKPSHPIMGTASPIIARKASFFLIGRALVEEMCLLHEADSAVIWRDGAGAMEWAASQGHCLAALNISGVGDGRLHEWVFKDSIGGVSKVLTTGDILDIVDNKEAWQLDFGLVLDLIN
jgi:hypothetical protein